MGLEDMSVEWNWLFGSEWEDVDNTPKGAAKRIRIFLESGVPEAFLEGNWEDLYD